MSAPELDPGGELRELAGDCVHCGFCLPACPTYQLWGEEMDSPRGRIHLITQILDGAPGTEAAASHLDRCLGCMACVPACPSGVRYDRLIEAAREWAEQPGPATAGTAARRRAWRSRRGGRPARRRPARALPARSRRDRAVRRAIFETFPYPGRLRLLMAPLRAAQRAGADRLLGRSDLAARLAPELTAALRIAPPPAARAGRGRATRLPERIPARGQRRAVVGMLTGCVQRVFFPDVNAATARVLAAEGCDVIVPRGQGCCGALSLHGGRRAEAAAFARHTIEAFERAGVDAHRGQRGRLRLGHEGVRPAAGGRPGWAERAAALSAKVGGLQRVPGRARPGGRRASRCR